MLNASSIKLVVGNRPRLYVWSNIIRAMAVDSMSWHRAGFQYSMNANTAASSYDKLRIVSSVDFGYLLLYARSETPHFVAPPGSPSTEWNRSPPSHFRTWSKHVVKFDVMIHEYGSFRYLSTHAEYAYLPKYIY